MRVVIPTRQYERRHACLHAADPRSRDGNLTAAYRLRCALSDEQCVEVVRALMSTHEYLAGSIEACDRHEYVVAIDRSRAPLVGFSRAECTDDAAWESFVSEFAVRQDRGALYGDRLYWIQFIRRTEDDLACVVTLTHDITDIFSFVMFCEDLLQSLLKYAAGTLSVPPPTTLTLAAFQKREESYLASDSGKRNRDDWLQRLGRLARPAAVFHESSRWRVVRGVLDAKGIASVLDDAQRNRTTPPMAFLGVYARALAAVLRRSDVAIRHVVSHRSAVRGAERLLTCSLDNAIYLLDGVDALSTDALLALVQRQRLDNIQKHIPYWKLMKDLDPSLYLAPCGLLENEFNFLPLLGSQAPAASSTVKMLPVATVRTWLPFRRSLQVAAGYDHWHLAFAFDEDTVAPSEAAAILRNCCSHMVDN